MVTSWPLCTSIFAFALALCLSFSSISCTYNAETMKQTKESVLCSSESCVYICFMYVMLCTFCSFAPQHSSASFNARERKTHTHTQSLSLQHSLFLSPSVTLFRLHSHALHLSLLSVHRGIPYIVIALPMYS